MGEPLRVLVACEESQEVCKAFRALGHEAYSCDILPCSGGRPEWHIPWDVRWVLSHPENTPCFFPKDSIQRIDYKLGGWVVGIFHPPCDDIAVSGARWFKEKRVDGSQRKAIEFFLWCWNQDIPKIAIENPIGIMSGKREYLKEHFPDLYEQAKVLPEPQIIQPWQFGHGETKATCLWLKGLPKLTPTNIVEGREHRVHRMAPGPNRSRDRARTYPGIAKAMAEQWSGATHSRERVR